MAATNEESIEGLIERVKNKTDGDEVSVSDLVSALGRRSFGPLFVLTSLVAILPTGAIPGMSILTGTVMLLLSLQILFGKSKVWLPNVVRRQTIPRETLVNSLDRADPYAKRIDRHVGRRLTMLTDPPFVQVMALFAVLVSLSMYPLALVPFGAFPAGLSLLVIGLGLMAKDGLVIAAGMALGALGLGIAIYFWPF